jgi:cell wall assembly regulator SMI1
MNQLWLRFENWLAKNAPHLLQRLNPAAKQEDIDKLETTIGRELPEDFILFYKIHNGQTTKEGREFLVNCEELLSIDNIIFEWNVWKSLLDNDSFGKLTSEPDEGVKNNWWNQLWIPFTADGCGNYVCIDLDPSTSGNFGQVMELRYDMACRNLFANSFTDYISNYVIGLETGKYICVEGWGIVEKDSVFNQP